MSDNEERIANIDARLDELDDTIADLEAQIWMRKLNYLIAEGFITLEDDRLYPCQAEEFPW